MPDCAALLATAQLSETVVAATLAEYNAAYAANIDAWMNYFSQCEMAMAASEEPKEQRGRERAQRLWDAMPDAFRKLWPELCKEEKTKFINGWCEP